jgi:hypothetical protein
MTDEDFASLLESYQLIRIRKANALTGPGGPGDLSWIWPLSTFVLLWLLIRKRRR